MRHTSVPRPARAKRDAHDRAVIRDYLNEVTAGLSRLVCASCGRVNGFDFYMVRSSVWKEAGLKRSAFCCLDCLSGRLNRELKIQDFALENPLNRPLMFGYRMGRNEAERASSSIEAIGAVPGLPGLPGQRRARTKRLGNST